MVSLNPGVRFFELESTVRLSGFFGVCGATAAGNFSR